MDGQQSPRWYGAFRVRDYLERSIAPDQVWPPEAAGVYVVTKLPWRGQPSSECQILYVGSNPNNSEQLRNRIGLLIKDMLGFWGDLTGSHSGGQTLWSYCERERINPLDLYFGWISVVPCSRCAEWYFFEVLQPELCRKAPAYCQEHDPALLPVMESGG
jgi:hypothetical protein